MPDTKKKMPIRTAHSCAADPRIAAAEFHAAVVRPDTQLVLFFSSNAYDTAVLGDEIRRRFDGIEVVGCTTAGEIGPSGYREHSLSGVGFAAGAASAVTGYMQNLQTFDISKGHTLIGNMLQKLESRSPDVSSDNSFAFLMIDGLSMREETVAHVLQAGLGNIPLVGGSAADGMRFSKTYVYHKGEFHSDGAVLVLIKTPLPFRVFKTQHFIPAEERLVATEVDAVNRSVMEINGRPAAVEYARATGFDEHNLSPTCFAASPVAVLMGGTSYVRSIQKVNPDNSLTFYCAIDEGLVFRISRGEVLEENLIQTLEDLQHTIGPLQLVLACDCILRRLEIINSGKQEKMAEIIHAYKMVGFNTYGEQLRGVHINQTLTGIAFGTAKEDNG